MDGMCSVDWGKQFKRGDCSHCFEEKYQRERGILFGRIDRMVCPMCGGRMGFPKLRLLPIKEVLLGCGALGFWRAVKTNWAG